MKEGWIGEEYVVLFEEKASSLEKAYGLGEFLTGYTLVGLHGWHDFIVEDGGGSFFTVPSVPLLKELLRPFSFEAAGNDFVLDNLIQGKIKWYVTPLIFGGDPQLEDNVGWVTLDQHIQLVKWWNEKYRELKAV
jgi:hypothetical protein